MQDDNFTYDGTNLYLRLEGKTYATKATEHNIEIKKKELYERYKNDTSKIQDIRGRSLRKMGGR